jgi:signal transduction histidine kinase
MGGLIEDVLDFARGQLGEGVTRRLEVQSSLELWLRQVIAESQAGKAGEPIHVAIDLPVPVSCDRARIGQLLTNLLANAMAHGDPLQAIDVHIGVQDDGFVLSVRNRGPIIPADMLPLIFQPFTRGQGGQPREGLGLGLYICAHIANAHQGELTVTSSAATGTCFTLRFPLTVAA